MHLIISKWLRRQKCRQKRFLQTELSAPAPYTPNPAIPTYFHTSNAKSYHLKTTAHKQEPLHRLPTFTLLLPLGRYAAPASLQNLQTPDFQTPLPPSNIISQHFTIEPLLPVASLFFPH